MEFTAENVSNLAIHHPWTLDSRARARATPVEVITCHGLGTRRSCYGDPASPPRSSASDEVGSRTGRDRAEPRRLQGVRKASRAPKAIQ